MTLQQFFDRIGEHPDWVLFYFAVLPLMALLAAWLGKNEGHLPPWHYFYAFLIYLSCIPGVFAIALNVYLFLFERRSIFDFNIYTQILPILSMLFTLWLIRRNVVFFDYIPGFQKLSGLVLMIFATIAIMWIVDRTRIVVFSYLKFEYVLGIFVVLLLLMLWGWRKLFN
ncbi:MAG: hypothetical protein U0X91_10545 [Spirosomataceae bacterium]